MKEPVYYQETIISKLNAAIFAAVIGWLLVTLFFNPLEIKTDSSNFLITLILLFASLGLNFSYFRVTLHSDGVLAGYGLLQQDIPWEKIVRSYQDETTSFLYGGWGIRLSRIKGNWRLVQNIVGAPRVVLELKEGWYREFAFSTQNPEEVITIINQRKKGS